MSTWIDYIIKPKTDKTNGLTVLRDPHERQDHLEVIIPLTDDYLRPRLGMEDVTEAVAYIDYGQVEELRDQLNAYLTQKNPYED